jgi:hypothetical protein
MTETEILRTRFLDWLCDHRPEPPAELVVVGEFFGGDGYPPENEQQLWRDLIRGMRDDELIRLGGGMDVFPDSAWLTGKGRADVQARRVRRSDSIARAAACRDALVRWLHGQPRHGGSIDVEPFFESPLSFYEGVRFESVEVELALEYLEKKGLIKGVQVAEYHRPINPSLTDSGIDCAEQFGGRVAAYLRRSEGYGVRDIITTHIGGDLSGHVAIANRGDTNQTQYRVDQVAPGFEAVAQAVAGTLERLSDMGLSEEDLEDAEAAANEVLEEVARPNPERRKVKRAVTALMGALALVASGAVSGASEGAHELARKAFEHLSTLVF